MMTSGRIAALSLLVGSVAAQSASGILSSLSQQCVGAASGLIQGDFAACADMKDLFGVIEASGSIVDPLNTWATNLCKQSACSNDTITSASGNISSGCASDLASGNLAAVVLQTITTDFSQVKDLVCLQSSSNSTSCLTNFLTNVQTATNTQLTTDQLEQMASASGIENLLSQLPASDVCTDCNSAVLDQALSSGILNSSEGDQLKSTAQGQCGSSFGTSIPSDVKEAASSASRTIVSIGALAGLSALALL